MSKVAHVRFRTEKGEDYWLVEGDVSRQWSWSVHPGMAKSFLDRNELFDNIKCIPSPHEVLGAGSLCWDTVETISF